MKCATPGRYGKPIESLVPTKEENAFSKYVNKVIDEKECGHEAHSDLSFEDFVKQEESKREDFKAKYFGIWQDAINTEAVKLGEECKKK